MTLSPPIQDFDIYGEEETPFKRNFRRQRGISAQAKEKMNEAIQKIKPDQQLETILSENESSAHSQNKLESSADSSSHGSNVKRKHSLQSNISVKDRESLVLKSRYELQHNSLPAKVKMGNESINAKTNKVNSGHKNFFSRSLSRGKQLIKHGHSNDSILLTLSQTDNSKCRSFKRSVSASSGSINTICVTSSSMSSLPPIVSPVDSLSPVPVQFPHNPSRFNVERGGIFTSTFKRSDRAFFPTDPLPPLPRQSSLPTPSLSPFSMTSSNLGRGIADVRYSEILLTAEDEEMSATGNHEYPPPDIGSEKTSIASGTPDASSYLDMTCSEVFPSNKLHRAVSDFALPRFRAHAGVSRPHFSTPGHTPTMSHRLFSPPLVTPSGSGVMSSQFSLTHEPYDTGLQSGSSDESPRTPLQRPDFPINCFTRVQKSRKGFNNIDSCGQIDHQIPIRTYSSSSSNTSTCHQFYNNFADNSLPKDSENLTSNFRRDQSLSLKRYDGNGSLRYNKQNMLRRDTAPELITAENRRLQYHRSVSQDSTSVSQDSTDYSNVDDSGRLLNSDHLATESVSSQGYYLHWCDVTGRRDLNDSSRVHRTPDIDASGGNMMIESSRVHRTSDDDHGRRDVNMMNESYRIQQTSENGVSDPQDDINLNENQSNLIGNQINLHGNQSNFIGNQSNFNGDQSNMNGNQSNFQGNQSNFNGNQNNLNGNQGNLNSNQGVFHTNAGLFPGLEMSVDDAAASHHQVANVGVASRLRDLFRGWWLFHFFIN